MNHESDYGQQGADKPPESPPSIEGPTPDAERSDLPPSDQPSEGPGMLADPDAPRVDEGGLLGGP